MPRLGDVRSVALGDRSKGTVFEPAPIHKATVAAVAEVVDNGNAAINARFAELEGMLGQLINVIQSQASTPVVAAPLSTETVTELTPAQKAAATKAAKKLEAEDATKEGE